MATTPTAPLPFKAESFVFVKPQQILRLENFPYRDLKETRVEELATDIAANGLLQNIVIWNGGGKGKLRESKKSGTVPAAYLLAGAHRLEALKRYAKSDATGFQAKFPNGVPCRVIGGDLADAIAAMVRENVQREGVTYGDLLPAIKALTEDHKLSTAEVGKKIGKSKAYVSQVLGIEKELGPEATTKLVEAGIAFSAARSAVKKNKDAKKSGGKGESADEIVEKLKSKKKAGKKGKAAPERRTSPKELLKRFDAMPKMKLSEQLEILRGAFNYVAKLTDELPVELQNEVEEAEGDEKE